MCGARIVCMCCICGVCFCVTCLGLCVCYMYIMCSKLWKRFVWCVCGLCMMWLCDNLVLCDVCVCTKCGLCTE